MHTSLANSREELNRTKGTGLRWRADQRELLEKYHVTARVDGELDACGNRPLVPLYRI